MGKNHPVDFESVSFSELWKLPRLPGIYFAMQSDEILYVGQSKDIRERWRDHHKSRELVEFDGIRIHWIESDGRPLLQQESEWVSFCHPPLNGRTIIYQERREKGISAEMPFSITMIFLLANIVPNLILLVSFVGIYLKPEIWLAGMVVLFMGLGCFLSSQITVLSIKRKNCKKARGTEAAAK